MPTILTLGNDASPGRFLRAGPRQRDVRRILLVLQSADPPTSIGGMETLCVDLAAEFVRRGLQVAVIVPQTAVFDPLVDRFHAAGAVIERLNTDARKGRLEQIRCWWRLARFTRHWRPDAVHLHTGGATGGLAVVATARWITPATVVVTEHNVPVAHVSTKQRLARHALDRLSHAVVAVSRRNAALRRERLGAMRRKFAAILNGVSIEDTSADSQAANRRAVRSELAIDRSAVVIGSLVRFAVGKGLNDLLRAFALVRREHLCELLLVGDGPLRGELESLARELDVGAYVHFAGHQAKPVPFLDAMDIFALCVPAGSQSIALLEAMARGLAPVITFWGPEEAVVPEVTGLPAPPNDPEGLAHVLERIVGNANLRSQLGTAASQHVRRHFSVQRVADDLLELYGVARSDGVPERLQADGPPPPTPELPAREGAF